MLSSLSTTGVVGVPVVVILSVVYVIAVGPMSAVMRLRGKDYPLDLVGTAWINPDSWTIEQIEAQLESPLEDLNLHSLRTTVRYAPQYFQSVNESEWLPVEASIDVETARQHWRNTHKFTDYRRFSVKSESVISK